MSTLLIFILGPLMLGHASPHKYKLPATPTPVFSESKSNAQIHAPMAIQQKPGAKGFSTTTSRVGNSGNRASVASGKSSNSTTPSTSSASSPRRSPAKILGTTSYTSASSSYNTTENARRRPNRFAPLAKLQNAATPQNGTRSSARSPNNNPSYNNGGSLEPMNTFSPDSALPSAQPSPVVIGGVEGGADSSTVQNVRSNEASGLPIFDIPITYNERVQFWVRYFQTTGRSSFQKWLERSSRYSPYIKDELSKAGLPQDIIYTAMIESGFSPGAESTAAAMGLWQFIKPTGERYGLKVTWWLDERKNFVKATQAAIKYKKDLYRMFGSWPLVAASYNCGENRIVGLIKKHHTKNFWQLAHMGLLPKETMDYVPKIIAATLISKAPGLYGFRNMDYQVPFEFETARVPGGTDLHNLAQYLGVSPNYLKELNPDLTQGFIPPGISNHTIKIPKGSTKLVSQYSDKVSSKRL